LAPENAACENRDLNLYPGALLEAMKVYELKRLELE
jgi:hypothetical protein